MIIMGRLKFLMDMDKVVWSIYTVSIVIRRFTFIAGC